MNRLLALAALCLASALHANDFDPKGVELFEKKIRPVLVEHCYKCHSTEAKKDRGGLLVDNRASMLTGGDTGPAVVPGQPAKSLLLTVLRYQGDVKMPPKLKLPDSVVADFELWIKLGAPDPRAAASPTTKLKSPTVEEGKNFWAYKPVVKPAVPAVKNAAWPKSDVDRFILSAIEARGHKPADDAAPRVLLRRLTFDLIGLPPTAEELAAFESAAQKDFDAALEATVDRLLQSPHFGERWGRHWLDVARFAESFTLRGFVTKEAWRYRDYVIDSFNDDVPFDRFIREQLAGDLLPAADAAQKRRQMLGTTFLTMGNTNLEEQDKKLLRMDVVDEQLDTLGRAFLGQTIGCARCHDHKFDPIPTLDYYALAGILRSTKTVDTSTNVGKWLEMPLPALPGKETDTRAYDAAVAKLQKEISELKAIVGTATTAPKATKPVPIALKDLPGIAIDDTQAMKVGTWTESTHNGYFVGAGYLHDGAAGQGEKTLTFQAMLPHTGKYEVRFAYSPGTNRAKEVPVTVHSEEGEKTIMINQTERPAIDGLFVSLGQYQFEKTGQCFVMVENKDAKGHVTADAVVFIPVEKLVEVKPIAAPKAPAGKIDPAAAAQLKKLEEQMAKLVEKGSGRDMVMTVQEEKKIENARIHIRGSVANQGAEVPRGFLQVAAVGKAPVIGKTQSGRVELADWIAHPDNPLTARVAVNRTWGWLLGDGIVRTVDNFGKTGETPSHPELLDYLATRFVEEGWSQKKLIRLLVLSRTYRQASGPGLKDDPENRLYARANRKRLDAECIRDAILAVSGQLDTTRGGMNFKPIASDYTFKHNDLRRSVYAPIFRNALPEIFEAFDFADPSVSTGKRNVSTVAPQALFMMNNPMVIQQSQAAAKRLLKLEMTDEERIGRAYQLALGRDPTDAERGLIGAYIGAGNSKSREETWARVMQTLFASIDFRFTN